MPLHTAQNSTERPSEREGKLLFLLLSFFVCLASVSRRCVCVSVSLSGWMSQLTESSSITQKSDGAELTLTDGEVKRRREGRRNH